MVGGDIRENVAKERGHHRDLEKEKRTLLEETRCPRRGQAEIRLPKGEGKKKKKRASTSKGGEGQTISPANSWKKGKEDRSGVFPEWKEVKDLTTR